MNRHRQILLAVILLVAVVISFAVRIAIQVYDDHRDVDTVLAAERLKTRVIGLTSELARERGWSMALLGSHPAARPRVVDELKAVRAAADRNWLALADQIEQLTPQQRGNALLDASIVHMRGDWSHLVALRNKLDSTWQEQPGEHYRETFETITDLIGAAREVWKTVEAPGPRELTATHRYQQIRDQAWMLSEYAGQERGLLSYFVSRSEALPADDRKRLHLIRALVDHHQRELTLARERQTIPHSIVSGLQRMQTLYYDHFNPYREVVYSAIDSGGYLISGVEWVKRATNAIDSMVGVSEEVGSAIQDQLYTVVARSQRDVVVTIALLVLVCVAVIFIFSRVLSVVEELFEQKRLAEITLGSIGDGVITTDSEGRIEYLNSAAEKMTGWHTEDARGHPFDEVFPLVNRYTMEKETNAVKLSLMSGLVTAGGNDSLLVRRDGTEIGVYHSSAPINDNNGAIVGAVTVFYDLLNTWSEQHLLSYHATHDSLTGLINRGEFERCIHALASRMHLDKEQHALCYLDVDQFKVINDTCGHQAGDILIGELTGVLRQHIRATDLLARLGGDEFGLLLQDCGPREAAEVTETLRRAVDEFRFRYDEHVFSVGLSIGVVPITGEIQSPVELMALADTACFTAKEKGRNQIHIYQPDDPDISKRHSDMRWVTRIQQAMENDEFELYCQPIVKVSNCGPFAAEILLRMKSNDGVSASPGVFIPAAERFGLMGAIDRWVVEHTFAALKRFDAWGAGMSDMIFTINLSGASLSNPSMVEFIQLQFEHYRIEPRHICFEVTETAAIANFKVARALLMGLRAEGCKIALDDFGTGLSSFAYLRDLPIDYIKMGGGFVRDMTEDKGHEAMVQATNAVALAMGVPMIAESVEEMKTAELLHAMGVEYMQGYGIARPMPLKQFFANDELDGGRAYNWEMVYCTPR